MQYRIVSIVFPHVPSLGPKSGPIWLWYLNNPWKKYTTESEQHSVQKRSCMTAEQLWFKPCQLAILLRDEVARQIAWQNRRTDLGLSFLHYTLPLEIVLEQFLVLFWPGTMSVRSGLGTFFVLEPEHAKHFSVLSETVTTVSLSAPPTIAHTRRWAVNTMPAVGQTMQFSDNYLNDGHFPPEMPRIDGRDSFSFVWQPLLVVSFEVHDAAGTTTTYVVVVCSGWLQREQGNACRVGKVHIKQCRILCGRCDLWNGIWRHQIKWPSLS